MLGVGVSSGKNQAEEEAVQATSAPLIDRLIDQDTGVIYNISGGKGPNFSSVEQSVTVSDGTGKTLFVARGTVAEQLIGHTTAALMRLRETEGVPHVFEVLYSVLHHQIAFQDLETVGMMGALDYPPICQMCNLRIACESAGTKPLAYAEGQCDRAME